VRPIREPFDPYTTLGLSPGADRAEIGRAYRRRAREIHPDATGRDTTAAMARLKRARDEAIARARPGPRRTTRPESGAAPGSAGADERSERPAAGTDHEPEWADYWSAWNEPPRRWRRPHARGAAEG
jgi:curved DNA-binding protein CbpA